MNIAGLKLDEDFNPIEPVIVLAERNGKKKGVIPKTEFRCRGNLSSADEISFIVHKAAVPDEIWAGLKDLRLCWIRDWDAYFEISVTVDDEDSVTKKVTGVSLGEAELSQTNLYGVEINTEKEITNSGADYSPTVFYDPSDEKHSLMHRMLERTCYSPGYVDECLWKEQRTFSFNDKSIKDGFDEVAKELKCLFVYRNNTGEDGRINRVVDVYNLDEERKEEDGSPSPVYGNDTGIFISDENIAKKITLTTNTGNVKNCFKLVGGDDIMTAAIAGCNPSGTSYLWYITDDMKETMSDSLTAALDKYDALYHDITENIIEISNSNFALYAAMKLYVDMLEDVAGGRYDVGKNYSVGDMATYNGSAFRCREAVTAGETWDEKKWEYVYGEHNAIFSGLQTKKIDPYDLSDMSTQRFLKGDFACIRTEQPTPYFWTPFTVLIYECIQDFCYGELPEPKLDNHPTNFTDYWTERTDLEFVELFYLENLYYVYADNVAQLSEYHYDTIDLSVFLSDTMMPDYNIMEMNLSFLESTVAKIVDWFRDNAIGVNVESLSSVTEGMVTRAAEGMAKTIADARIKVTVSDVNYDDVTQRWGCTVTASAVNTDGKNIMATSTGHITITLVNETFIKQKIEKALSKKLKKAHKEALAEMEAYRGVYTPGESYQKNDIVWYSGKMFRCISNEDIVEAGKWKDSSDDWECFDAKIRYYSVSELNMMLDCCEGCLAVLIEQGADGNSDTTVNGFYHKYNSVIQALLEQKQWRETQVDLVNTIGDVIRENINRLNEKLNMENSIGEDNMTELLSYRRETTYSNSNFISDGLTNHELMKRAALFFDDAVKEIYQSAEKQHSISSNIYNLLAIKEFASVRDQFVLGNWLREKIDGSVYKLRLVGYELNFADITLLTVEFSDLLRSGDSVSDIKSILDKAKSVSSTYGYTARQADRSKAAVDAIDTINRNGIDVEDINLFSTDKSVQWTQGGFILRKYDELTGAYSPKQMKLLSTGIYYTEDNWETVNKVIEI